VSIASAVEPAGVSWNGTSMLRLWKRGVEAPASDMAMRAENCTPESGW